MINLGVLLLSALYYVLAGWYLTYMLGAISKIERIGIAFLLGAGFSTFVWFLLYLTGIPFNLYSFFTSGLLVLLLTHSINWLFHLKLSHSHVSYSIGTMEKILIWAIAITLLTSLLIAIYNPITVWDAITLYDFRAHVIVSSNTLEIVKSNSYYASYPLMVTLVHAAYYFFQGTNPQGMHTLFLLAFSSIVYGRMLSWTNRRVALISVLMLILNEEIFAHSTVAYVNLTYTIFLVCSLLYTISLDNITKKPGYIIIASLLIGLSTWVRSDLPFWWVVVPIILIQGWRLKSMIITLVSLYLGYLIKYSWVSYYYKILNFHQQNNSTPSPLGFDIINKVVEYMPTYDIMSEILSKLPQLIQFIYSHIYSPYRAIWFSTLPLTILALKIPNFRLRLLLLSLFLTIAVSIYGTMLFSTSYASWDRIGGSAQRMILFAIPLGIISACYALFVTRQYQKNEY